MRSKVAYSRRHPVSFMWVVLVIAMLNRAYDGGRDEAMHGILKTAHE